MSPSTLSPLLYHQLINLQPSRRLLQHHQPVYQTPPTTTATPPPPRHNPVDPTEPYSGTNGFDANVVMVLSVLLCALICSLGLNSIIKCALRCSNFIPTQPNQNTTNNNSNNNPNPSGIKKKALKSFAVVSYSPNLNLPGLGTDCVICLSDFAPGDKLRLLPKCQHGFHIRCIDKWLNTHSSCPTCRHCLIQTCQKIVGSEQGSSSDSSMPPQQQQESIINMVPLQREDLVRGFRDNYC